MSTSNSSSARPTGNFRPDLSAYSQSDSQAPFTDAPEFATPEARITENEARNTRNEERARRRELETDVEEDEVMLDLTPPARVQHTVNQAPPAPTPDERSGVNGGAQGGTEEEKLKAFRLALSLEGTAREQALETLRFLYGTPGQQEKSKSSSKEDSEPDLLQEGPDVPDDPASSTRLIDCRLITLVKLGFYLPLTLCTNAAMEAVEAVPSLLVCKTQNDAKSNKITVVDPDVGWPRERELTSEDWKDAWANFLRALPEILSPTGVARMRAHFDFLHGQENFSVRFRAIVRFDVKIRHRYFWGKKCKPFHVGSSAYMDEFRNIRDDVTDEDKMFGTTPSAPRHQPYNRNDRNDRYTRNDRNDNRDRNDRNDRNDRSDRNDRNDRYDRNNRNDRGGGGAPFQGGRSHASAAPLCLVCAGSGHRADSCTRTKLTNGKPCFSVSANRRIYAVQGGAEICMSWNASGQCKYYRCPQDAKAHGCAFCGATDHHAGSKVCV